MSNTQQTRYDCRLMERSATIPANLVVGRILEHCTDIVDAGAKSLPQLKGLNGVLISIIPTMAEIRIPIPEGSYSVPDSVFAPYKELIAKYDY